MMTTTKTPVSFLSHGGVLLLSLFTLPRALTCKGVGHVIDRLRQPNIMFDTQHSVFPESQEVGKEIAQKVPKGGVVFSANWQESSNVISVNAAENTELIYQWVYTSY
jgi:aromatic ring-opening dioxygenase catalytic subunit (LigB family)